MFLPFFRGCRVGTVSAGGLVRFARTLKTLRMAYEDETNVTDAIIELRKRNRRARRWQIEAAEKKRDSPVWCWKFYIYHFLELFCIFYIGPLKGLLKRGLVSWHCKLPAFFLWNWLKATLALLKRWGKGFHTEELLLPWPQWSDDFWGDIWT